VSKTTQNKNRQARKTLRKVGIIVGPARKTKEENAMIRRFANVVAKASE
jgi:hypothetical protein